MCFVSKKELVKRYILFVISLYFSALGVGFGKHAALGLPPISSVANVLSFRFDALSIGTWLILWNCAMVVAQIFIMGKKFQLVQLVQIPMSVIFGTFTDFALWSVSFIPANSYIVRMILVLVGVAVLAFGITLSVIADVVMNAGDALVRAIAWRLDKNFGNVKVVFDVCCVSTAIILSLLFFGTVIGTREGTLISSIATGFVVKFLTKRLKAPVTALLQR